MRKARSFWLLVAAVLMVVLLFVVWHGSTNATRTVKLADGRVLTIEKVSFGTKHKFFYGSIWERAIGPILPDKWSSKAGVRSITLQPHKPNLVIWGKWQLPTNGPMPATWAILKGETGDEQIPVAATPSSGVIRGGKLERVSYWSVENFPRRAAMLRFEVCETTNGIFRPIAAFTLPNPCHEKFPVWQAQPSRIRQRTNGFEFELASFTKGRFPDEIVSLFGRPQQSTGYVAVIRVTKNGRAQDNWRVESATVSDATGNRIMPRSALSFMLGDYLVFGLHSDWGPLWPGESAWKLAPQFIRTAGFASNELCTLRGISGCDGQITRSEDYASVRAETNSVLIIGVTMRHVGGGFGQQRIRQDLEIEPLLVSRSDRQVTLFHVTDDKGRQLRHDRSYYNTDGKHFGIELLPDSQSLDLTFAVQEPVVVEFLTGLSSPAGERRQ